ncbi:MAG: hypothetical protein AAGO57_02540 [Pseudomonadota bacterium]
MPDVVALAMPVWVAIGLTASLVLVLAKAFQQSMVRETHVASIDTQNCYRAISSVLVMLAMTLMAAKRPLLSATLLPDAYQ